MCMMDALKGSEVTNESIERETMRYLCLRWNARQSVS